MESFIFCAIVLATLVWEFSDDFPVDTDHKRDLIPRGIGLLLASFLPALVSGPLVWQEVLINFVSASILFWVSFDILQNVRLGRAIDDTRPGGSAVDTLFAQIGGKFYLQIFLVAAWPIAIAWSSPVAALTLAVFIIPLGLLSRKTKTVILARWKIVMLWQGIITIFAGLKWIQLRPGDEPEWLDAYSVPGLIFAAIWFVLLLLIIRNK